MLWLAGGPSQLETFDPHPGTTIAGGTKAISTAAQGIQLADGFEQLADQMGSVALLRSIVSKEGDHERGTYMMKTGFRPETTIEHPSVGAICCHELPAGRTVIPRHVSILPGRWPSRGGYLGGEYDAFLVDDPRNKLPDVTAPVSGPREIVRVSDLEVVERAFARGRTAEVKATLHRETVKHARVMMTSDQLKAFDVAQEPAGVVAGSLETNQFGTNEFITWAREVGAEPLFGLNFGTASAEDAAALVEYGTPKRAPSGVNYAAHTAMNEPIT